MEKRILLSNEDYLTPKERRITPFVFTKSGCEIDDRFSKTAACDESLEFASKLQPIPGYRIILVTGMGCTEYWGANKKADTFPINGLLGKYPSDVPPSFFDRHKHKIPKVWGITTFPSKYDKDGVQVGGGNTFLEHNNRVPPDLMGKPVVYSNPREPRAGYIIKEFWNPKVFRVEIIQTVSEEKAPKWVSKIDKGEPVGVSMACDVGFDRCLKCGNLATSVNDYCACLRDRKTRGIIDMFGDLYAMANDFPYFFDMTLTERPADPVATMLTKVAFSSSKSYKQNNDWNYGNDYLEYSKQANLGMTNLANGSPFNSVESNLPHKVVHIVKSPIIDSISHNLHSYRINETPFPLPVVKKLRSFPLENLLTYLSAMSISPTHEDFTNLMFDVPPGLASLIARKVPLMASNLNPNISTIDIKITIEKSDPSPEEFKKVLMIIEPCLEEKSYRPEYLFQRKLSKMASAAASDYSDSTDQLGRQAQAVLLARLLTEPDLLSKLTNFLKSPFVRKQLEMLGFKFDETDGEIMKNVLRSNSESLYYNDRRNFFDKQ